VADFSAKIGSRCHVLAARWGSPFTVPSVRSGRARPARTLSEPSVRLQPAKHLSFHAGSWIFVALSILGSSILPAPSPASGARNLDLLMLASRQHLCPIFLPVISRCDIPRVVFTVCSFTWHSIVDCSLPPPPPSLSLSLSLFLV